MTTSMIRIMHCDFAGCDAQAPERTEGWTNAIYTHGCPGHGEAIAAHKATKTSRDQGRGSRAKTFWFLKCACGWDPGRHATHSASVLHDAHLRHVTAVTVTEWTEVNT